VQLSVTSHTPQTEIAMRLLKDYLTKEKVEKLRNEKIK